MKIIGQTETKWLVEMDQDELDMLRGGYPDEQPSDASDYEIGQEVEISGDLVTRAALETMDEPLRHAMSILSGAAEAIENVRSLVSLPGRELAIAEDDR